MDGSESWPFDQPPNAAAITTRQVIDDRQPILVVQHYSDDHSWAFLCSTSDDEFEGRVISMAEALAIDPSLRSIADLPSGWIAWREETGGPWQREEEE